MDNDEITNFNYLFDYFMNDEINFSIHHAASQASNILMYNHIIENDPPFVRFRISEVLPDTHSRRHFKTRPN